MEESRAHMANSSFTHNGDYFALLSVDGRLRIWDTLSGKVIQEFASNSAAQSSCTCVCWTRKSFNRGEKKKLKRKKRKGEKLGNDCIFFESLAIGTDKGYLFCYNPTSGELEKLTKDGHIDKINCVVYHSEKDLIYSCSEDKHIVEWCAKTHEVKSKWKADKRGIKRLCMTPSETSLLSAGSSIKLWNLETKELLQQFNGHSSSISMLQFSPYKQTIEDGKADDGCYFVSGSTGDRVINAWQINSKKTEKAAVASFVISDAPVFMDIILDNDDSQSVKLCVGCQDGRIHFFACTMNGRVKKPIESSKTVNLVQKEESSSTPLNFIDGRMSKTTDVILNLVYGQVLNLKFTSLAYKELDISSTIVKETTKNLLLKEFAKEKETPAIALASTDGTKFIADTSLAVNPSNIRPAPVANVLVNGNINKDILSSKELSMEERMKASQKYSKEFVVKMKPKKDAPNAGSFAQLLIQALHSKDDKLIHEMVFKNRFQPKVLMNTIKRVPHNLVELLLRTISDMLLWNPNRSSHLIVWLRTIMSVHLTFLLTSEMSREALANLYKLVKAQEEIYMPLLNLHGKIDMIFSYVSGNVDSEDEDDNPIETVTYEDSGEDTDETWAKKARKDIKEIEDSDASDEEVVDGLKDDPIEDEGEVATDSEEDEDNKPEHSDQESEDEEEEDES